MDTKYIKRDCPICDSIETETNILQSKIRAEDLTIEELRPYWNGFFKDKIFFSYYRCKSCGLLYNKNFFTKEQLDNLYSNMPDNTAGISVDILSKTQNAYYELMKEYINEDGDYLELGPDIGLFTKNIINNHNFNNIHLLEPNKKVWDKLNNLNKNKKVSISALTEDFSSIKNDSVTLAVMIHGPDHFINPKETMNKLKSKMKKGGNIIFVNHDESSLIAKITSANWPAYCMQHPQLFNSNTIKKLFEVSGFQVNHIYKTKNYFPILYLFKHGLWAMGLKIDIKYSSKYDIGLKLGNIMIIGRVK